MKICILTPRFPFPENGGDVLRINNICRYLKKKGHELILISYWKKNKLEQCSLSEQLYDRIYYVKYNTVISLINAFLALMFFKPIQIGFYFSFSFLAEFKKVINVEKPDMYVSHLIRMVPYLDICHLHNKSIIEMTDALSKTYHLSNKSKKISIKKLIYKIEKKRVVKYEMRLIKIYKKCVLVSEADRKYLDNLVNKNYLNVFTNGVKCLPNILNNYDSNKIIFVGNMRTLQNQDAVYFFIRDILPLVKKKAPKIVFHIIGAEPTKNIQEMADGKNVIVSGYVDSVEDEIKNAAIAVAPVRIAAGIQNKVLISMACGVPVILTSLISEGIPELVSNFNCIVADKKDDFANAVIELIENKEKRNEIAKEGYKMVLSDYSWEKKLNGYEDE